MHNVTEFLSKYYPGFQEIHMKRIIDSILIICIGFILHRLGKKIIKNAFDRSKRAKKAFVNIKKIDTTKTIVLSLFRYAMLILVIIYVLQIFSVNLTSILAVAGVGGIAIGIGAQSFVKDILNGMLVWFEDQYAVGDNVQISDITGIVEDLNLRTTKIRSYNGDLNIVPNSEIRIVTNMSKGFRRAIVDIDVSYHENHDKVIKIIEEELTEAKSEIPGITGNVEVVGIQMLKEFALSIRICALCEPSASWDVERTLRKRLLACFKREGIEVPYQRMIIDTMHQTDNND